MANERQRVADAQDSDLGLGTVAPNQIRRRILEKNGDFNVVRYGLSFGPPRAFTIVCST